MEFNYDLKKLSEILRTQKNNHILIFDHIYLTNFPIEEKTVKILKLESKLKDKIKQEASHNDNLKKLKINKSKLLNEIIILSEKIQNDLENTKYQEEMKAMEDNIYKLNSKIEEIENGISELPNEIRKINTQLMEEIVFICYNLMKDSEKKVNVINPELDNLKEKIKELTSEKKLYKKRWSKTYGLLHSLLGLNVIDSLEEK